MEMTYLIIYNSSICCFFGMDLTKLLTQINFKLNKKLMIIYLFSIFICLLTVQIIFFNEISHIPLLNLRELVWFKLF
jgi:hypothetical protein